MNPKKSPTKAAVEFDGDCFGRLQNDAAAECRACCVSHQCARMMNKVSEKEQTVAKKSKNKEEKKPKKSKEEATETRGRKAKQFPVSKIYKKDKDNAGFREGSFLWCAFKVWTTLKKGKGYTEDTLATRIKMFCGDVKLKYNSDRVHAALQSLRRLGLVAKEGEEYTKTVA